MTLQLMNQASSITVPFGTDLETFESQRTGTVDYLPWAKFWNAEISKGTTGETLTTELGGGGSRAAAEVHSEILEQLIDGDSDLLSGTLQDTVIRWLCDFNYPNAVRPSVRRLRPKNALAEEELMTKRAERRQAELDALDRGREMGYEPEDLDGWMRLANAYAVLQEEDRAIEAYRKVEALLEQQPANDPRRAAVRAALERLGG